MDNLEKIECCSLRQRELRFGVQVKVLVAFRVKLGVAIQVRVYVRVKLTVHVYMLVLTVHVYMLVLTVHVYMLVQCNGKCVSIVYYNLNQQVNITTRKTCI